MTGMPRGLTALLILLLATGLPLAASVEEAKETAKNTPATGEAAAASATSAPETGAAAASEENLSAAPASLPARLISNRWGFQVGGFLMEFSTEAAIGSEGLLGTLIQLEDRLGLDEDKTTWRAEGFVRFNNRHGLDIGYWQLNRDGQATLAEEVDFGGITYIAADLKSKWNTNWLKLAWRYALLNTPKGEAGITAGLSTYRWDLGLEGTARITDDQGGSIEVESQVGQGSTFTFLLPVGPRPAEEPSAPLAAAAVIAAAAVLGKVFFPKNLPRIAIQTYQPT